MTNKSGFNLYRKFKEALDKLPHQFFIYDAREVGLGVGDLQALKSRGILLYKRLNCNEGIWIKKW